MINKTFFSKTRIASGLFFLGAFFSAYAQSILWEKNLGGSSSDYAYSIKPTSEGGFFLTGYTGSSANGDVSGTTKGSNDGWAVKLDANGNITWEKNYGGSSNDAFYSGQQTADGGYVVAGIASSASGNISGPSKGSVDAWVVKLDASGAISWEKNYGGAGIDQIFSIQQTTDGGYVFAGDTMSSATGDVSGTNKGITDVWVVKIDATGTLTWQKNLGGASSDSVQDIKQTSDGGYILVGTSSSSSGDLTGNKGANDIWVIKLDASGNISWQKNFGGSTTDSGFAIQITSDGGYVVTGQTNSSASGDVMGNGKGGYDFWIIKLDAAGSISWEKNYGGAGIDVPRAIQQTTDGGYIVTGYVGSSATGDVTAANKGNYDVWLLKLDAQGAMMWQKNFGGTGTENALSILQTASGDYVTAGYTNSSANGDLAGTIKGSNDVWVAKFANPSLSTAQWTKNTLILSPNPAKNFAVIRGMQKGAEVLVLDTTGKLIYQSKATGDSLTLNTSSYQNGLYFVKVDGQTSKLLIAR